MNNITTDNKQSFIEFISKSTPEELNQFIMDNGKPPKRVLMYRLIDKSKYKTRKEYLEAKNKNI